MQRFNLDQHVAVVTGGLGLLGRRHCEALAQAGANVIIVDLDEEACREFAASLTREYGVKALGHDADVTDPVALRAVKEAVIGRFDRLDILVNSAAITELVEDPSAMTSLTRFEDFPFEFWRRSLRVNLSGVFLSCQILGGEMARRKTGSIINITSTYGLVAPDQSLHRAPDGTQTFFKSAAHPVSQGGVLALTRYLAAYWGRQGVRVNAVSLSEVQVGHSDHLVEAHAARSPLGRMAQPTDMQGAVLFLASEASSFVTGTTLVVDGGWTIW
jgi:NAD(P)-dependent dehydrogenase (short-subunit alcohol dehydrogenase family)